MKPSVRVVVSRRFACPAEDVYDAWLEPEWMRRWMAGPDGRDERFVRMGLDLRVGGKFSVVVEREGVEINRIGEYLELDRPELLVFRWHTFDCRRSSSRVVVEIFPCDGGCELTLTHVMTADSATFADKTASAWRKMLAELADTLIEKTNPPYLKAS